MPYIAPAWTRDNIDGCVSTFRRSALRALSMGDHEPRCALMAGFRWSYSPQGGDYWRVIYGKDSLNPLDCLIIKENIKAALNAADQEIARLESRLDPWRNEFGNVMQDSEGLSFRLVNWLLSKTDSEIDRKLIRAIFPNMISREEISRISCWNSPKSRLKGREGRINMKPGRVFRLIFPDHCDARIAVLVDQFKDEFGPKNFEYYIGKTANDFKFGFVESNHSPYENFMTSPYVKGAANSCMRYASHGYNGIHPSEAYASGDFEIHLVLLNGEVAARSIVYDSFASPIYASNQAAVNFMREEFSNREISFQSTGDWQGARLLKIPGPSGMVVAPYLDIDQHVIEGEAYFQIHGMGDLEFTRHHDGMQELDSLVVCSHCQDRVSDENTFTREDGEVVCESCYVNFHLTCQCCDEIFNHQDIYEVYINDAPVTSELHCVNCRDSEASLCCNGEFWTNNLTYTASNGETVSALQISDGDYFVCDWSEAILHESRTAYVVDSYETVDVDLIRNDDRYQQRPDGDWQRTEESFV